MLSQIIAGGIKCVSCDSTGRGHLEACAWFLLDFLPHMPFLFANLALYPFAVINHSHEYDYMLSPTSSAKESIIKPWSGYGVSWCQKWD